MSDFERDAGRTGRIALADRSGFSIGQTAIDPSLRTIRARETAIVEPRVMQVLVALHDAAGNVVSRERLIDLCWGGIIVGDDAINRAVAELRRAASRAGAEFEVETIPRIGYRLKSDPEPDAAAAALLPVVNRRTVLAGSAVAAVGMGGFFWLRAGTRDPATQQLLAEARASLRSELPADNRRAVELLERATRQAPRDAEAAGLLAIALRNATEFAPSDQVSQTVRRAELSAQRALHLDPGEGHALTALATLRPYMGDWIESEASLLNILEASPKVLPAINHLTTLYQSSGHLRRSKQLNDRALELDPLSPVFQFRGALKHWIFGQAAQADLMIERTLQTWPRHPAVWNARMMLFAYTGRAQSALTLLDNPNLGPQVKPKPLLELWRVSLRAIAERSQATVDRAVTANLGAVRKAEGQAVVSMMTLSTLGRIDEAFEVANGYFLGQGTAISPAFAERQIQLADQVWKRSMLLFTPATLAMRQDPRFTGLCEALGLRKFWAEPGHAPDYKEFDRPRQSATSG